MGPEPGPLEGGQPLENRCERLLRTEEAEGQRAALAHEFLAAAIVLAGLLRLRVEPRRPGFPGTAHPPIRLLAMVQAQPDPAARVVEQRPSRGAREEPVQIGEIETAGLAGMAPHPPHEIPVRPGGQERVTEIRAFLRGPFENPEALPAHGRERHHTDERLPAPGQHDGQGPALPIRRARPPGGDPGVTLEDEGTAAPPQVGPGRTDLGQPLARSNRLEALEGHGHAPGRGWDTAPRKRRACRVIRRPIFFSGSR
jgi:hypothetical protein